MKTVFMEKMLGPSMFLVLLADLSMWVSSAILDVGSSMVKYHPFFFTNSGSTLHSPPPALCVLVTLFPYWLSYCDWSTDPWERHPSLSLPRPGISTLQRCEDYSLMLSFHHAICGWECLMTQEIQAASRRIKISPSPIPVVRVYIN